MAGILIIGIYCFFWWLCWKFSGIFFKGNLLNMRLKRLVIFLFIAAVPYYYYLHEKSGYDDACDSVEVFFPKEKIDFPESFVTNYAFTENTAESFAVHFDYLITPPNRTDAQLDKGVSQFHNYTVYPLEGKNLPNSQEDKKRVKESVRFGYFHKGLSLNERVSINTTFIYDFKDDKKISSYSSVSYSRGLHTLAQYAFPIDFKYCEYKNEKYPNFDFDTKTFFNRTFKNTNEGN